MMSCLGLLPFGCEGYPLCLTESMKGCQPCPLEHARCIDRTTAHSDRGRHGVAIELDFCIGLCDEGFHLEWHDETMIQCHRDAETFPSLGLYVICCLALFIMYCLALLRMLSCRPSLLTVARGICARFKMRLIGIRCPRRLSADIARDECPICLNKWSPNDIVRKLPCPAAGRHGHCFHAACIDQWLKTSRRCPMCNNDCANLMDLTPLLLSSPCTPRCTDAICSPRSMHWLHGGAGRCSPGSVNQAQPARQP